MASLKDLFTNLSTALRPSVGVGGGTITVHDTTEDPNGPFRALWIGSAGDVSLLALDGTSITLKNVPVGLLSVGARRINSTGTSVASPNVNITGLY